jgi:hypothetical protein
MTAATPPVVPRSGGPLCRVRLTRRVRKLRRGETRWAHHLDNSPAAVQARGVATQGSRDRLGRLWWCRLAGSDGVSPSAKLLSALRAGRNTHDQPAPVVWQPVAVNGPFALPEFLRSSSSLTMAYFGFSPKGPTAIVTLVAPVQLSVILMVAVFSGFEKLRYASFPLKEFTNVHPSFAILYMKKSIND